MEVPAIDLTDLLEFDLDDAATAASVLASPGPLAAEPSMCLEIEDDEDPAHATAGTLVPKADSDRMLAATAEPLDLAPEALCLFYDSEDEDSCTMFIEDEDEVEDAIAPPALAAPTALPSHVVAFNGGGSSEPALPGEHIDLVLAPSLHTIEAHRIHLVGTPLDAVHMLLRSQIPDADRVAQPDCASAVIKAHHDLRFWEPLLGDPHFTGHVTDFVADLTRLRKHRPDPSRSSLWQQWKQAHDGLLALLPEQDRLAI